MDLYEVCDCYYVIYYNETVKVAELNCAAN